MTHTNRQSGTSTVRSTSSPLTGVGRSVGDAALPPAETALMRAVLEDAVMCYLGRGRRRRIDARILAREAEHWMRSDDWESPFSFNNICCVLGLAPESTRPRILAWKDEEQTPRSIALAAE